MVSQKVNKEWVGIFTNVFVHNSEIGESKGLKYLNYIIR